MANAGQGYPIDEVPGATPHVTLDPQDLVDAFKDIFTRSPQLCLLSLDGEVGEDAEDQCEVLLDDVPLESNSTNGWRLNNPSEVEILGDACESILNGTLSNITVICPCGYVVS